MYAQLEEGVGSIFYGYMCIVLCMKLLWCNGFPEIYAQLDWGCQSAMGRLHCAIYETYLV